MSIHVYCVLVVRAWTYEYGLNQMMSGGFSLGMESCKGLGSVSLKNKQPTHTPHLRSIVPNVQRRMAYFALPVQGKSLHMAGKVYPTGQVYHSHCPVDNICYATNRRALHSFIPPGEVYLCKGIMKQSLSLSLSPSCLHGTDGRFPNALLQGNST